MNYLKLILKPAFWTSNIELLLITVLALFLVVSPRFLVFGDPFAFGEKNMSLALMFPLVGFTFVGFFIKNAFEKNLVKPTINIQIGMSLIILSVVINGYFSVAPEFGLYWLLCFGFFGLCVLWKPLKIKADLAMILFLIGLVLGVVNSLESPAMVPVMATGWALWFWYFVPKVNPAQKTLMFLLTVGFFVSFSLYLMGTLFLSIAIFYWWKQQKNYRRKSLAIWWTVFVFGLITLGILAGGSLKNFVTPEFTTTLGVGIYQALPAFHQQSPSVILPTEIMKSGLSIFWYEWGVMSFMLFLGLALTWAKKTNVISLWILFLGLLSTFPGIVNQPHFWLVLVFFTFGSERFLPAQS